MTRLLILTAIALAALVVPAEAQEVYLIRGLAGLSNFRPLQNDLERQGARTEVYRHQDTGRIVNEVMARQNRQNVIIGHSQGARSAFDAGNAIYARGGRVQVIGLDPLCSWPHSNFGGTNIYGNNCTGQFGVTPHSGAVEGAHNIVISGVRHQAYPTDRRVRDTVVGIVYGGGQNARR